METLAGYEILEPLHIGINVLAYRGVRLYDQKKVILKVLNTEHTSHYERAVLQNEYQLLKRLHKPEIIQAYELIYDQSNMILVLEDVEGQSLKQFINGQALALEQFFKIALQLIDSISVLHQQKIIHKDIKSDNFIINPQTFMTRLINFSFASSCASEAEMTVNPNVLEGALAYMSPEQTGRTNYNVDNRSDFYSLGIVFYEMLTGQVPFTASDPIEMIHCHLAITPPLVLKNNNQIPEMVAYIVAKLLAKSPGERYMSSQGLYADVEKCYTNWKEKGSIAAFQLAQNDTQKELQISQKLYGREQQIAQLLESFKHTSLGQAGLVLVSGYAGTGKTSVIKELHKPIMREHGYYVSGKFEKLKRDIPYSALIKVFNKLIEQILRESTESINQFKQEILNSVKSNGQLIINVLPDLELLIGAQPSVTELAPVESQNRFSETLRNFIQVFAKKEHPLAIMLDDLQWADMASLNFIQQLLADRDTRYLLIIGSYRDNEVDDDHLLRSIIEKIKNNNRLFAEIVLLPLSRANVYQLLADTFNVPPDATVKLTDIIMQRTEGNPFFITEFLKTLYQDKLLTLEIDDSRWNWSNENINKMATSTVVDLILARIKKLPQQTQSMLELASCLGNIFNLQELAMLSGQTAGNTFNDLQEAVQAQLIIPLGRNYHLAEILGSSIDFSEKIKERIDYKFIHDRIQQAAGESIGKSELKRNHLKIARMQIAQQEPNSHDERLFSILNHYNYSLELIGDSSERLQVAEYNFWAGIQAKSSTAYEAALKYFENAVELLPYEIPQDKIKWIFALNKAQMECHYLLGEFKQAEQFFQKALSYAVEKINLIELYTLKIILLKSAGKYEDGIKVGVGILNKFGFFIPEQLSTFEIVKEFIKLKFAIGRRKIIDIKFKPATDKIETALMKLVSAVIHVATVYDQLLFAYINFYTVRRALKYGYGFNIGSNCLMLAVIFISRLNRYAEGMQWIKLAEKIPDTIQDIDAGKIAYINHWSQPMDNNLAELLQAFKTAQENGKHDVANAAISLYASSIYWLGKPLSECAQAAHRALKYAKKINDYEYSNIIQLIYNHEKELASNHILTQSKLSQLNHYIDSDANPHFLIIQLECAAIHYMFGYCKEALKYLELAKDIPRFFNMRFICLQYFFYSALILAEQYSFADKSLKSIYYKKLKSAVHEIKIWSDRNPANFKFYYLLASAEMAFIDNKITKATELFDDAIQEAKRLNNKRLIALANERLGKLLLKINKPMYAKSHLQEAYNAYQGWEAHAKAKQLEEEYPDLVLATDTIFSEKTSQAKAALGDLADKTEAGIEKPKLLKNVDNFKI